MSAAGSVINLVFRSKYLNLLPMAGDVAVNKTEPVLYIQRQITERLMANGMGGRRAGAGRPPGSRWKPVVTELRAVAVERRSAIAASDRDPLNFLIATVLG